MYGPKQLMYGPKHLMYGPNHLMILDVWSIYLHLDSFLLGVNVGNHTMD